MPKLGEWESDWKDGNFRQLVAECASDPEVVKQFNALHGLNLPCPIPGLADPGTLLENKTEAELLGLAHFIYWIQQNLWQRSKAANLARLKRFYDARKKQ